MTSITNLLATPPHSSLQQHDLQNRASFGLTRLLSAHTSNHAQAETIPINSVADLNRYAGKTVKANDTLVLKNNIDARQFCTSIAFLEGKFEGNNHTIFKLRVPLIAEIKETGVVQNLVISEANIHTSEPDVAAVATSVAGQLNNILLHSSKIESTSEHGYVAGIAARFDTTLSQSGLTVMNSAIKSKNFAGAVCATLVINEDNTHIKDFSASGNNSSSKLFSI